MNKYIEYDPVNFLREKNLSLYFRIRNKLAVADETVYVFGDKGIIRNDLKKIYDICLNILSKCPDGNIRISGNSDHSSFYYFFRNKDNSICNRYISKKNDSDLIIRLCNKRYYEKLMKLVIKELNNPNCDHCEKYNIYDKLNPKIRKYVVPLLCSKQLALDCWNGTGWIKNDFRKENLIFETNRLDMVRSKSEKIIADLLFSNTNIKYQYDCGLILDDSSYPIFPDFIILNIQSGRLYIWEHAGMLDNPEYANEFVRKYNRYIENGYRVGIDVFFTIESQVFKYNSRASLEVFKIISG